MSKRGTKRATGRTDEPGPSKRRRVEQDDPLWNLRPVSDLKMSSIYNRSASDAPAELFRKDLISAMKLPDSEPLATNEYWVINDSWKQEWERGVQVPVNPDSLPAPTVEKITIPVPPGIAEFKLPKHKYVRLARDANFQPDRHQLSSAIARAESACSYDLDTTDSSWLVAFNGERARSGVQLLSEDQFERVIEELELRCWDKIQAILKSEEGLGIEYDENVICDVCRSPDSEEGNEMVFCDSCNICVHQACYGITSIPAGQWLCRPCGDGVKPVCVLCPNAGGAMKCTPSGHKWAHVSCVLWIPEVSIGCAEKMEPITKISSIPPSRWSLICVLCKERTGACIQCSVKTCKIAYHVTCAFKHGLEMRAIIEDENADDGVKLRSYCNKHSVNKKDKGQDKKESGSEEEEVKSKKRRKEMTSEEKKEARATRLQEIESEFHKQVSVKDISSQILGIDQDAISHIYNYWKVKRRAGHNRPLLPPKADDTDILSNRQEQADLDKMKMFVQLRQDLERVRNLCYMVSRREKLSRSFFRLREQTFHKQATVLTSIPKVDLDIVKAVIAANHGPSLYDQLYSHPKAEFSKDFQVVLSRIAGRESSVENVDRESTPVKSPQPSTSNPYRKVYTGTSSRRSRSIYSNSTYSEDSGTEQKEKIRPAQTYRRPIYSSTEDDEEPPKVTGKKKNNQGKDKSDFSTKVERKKARPALSSKSIIDSSTEEDTKKSNKKEITYVKSPPNKTLLKMQKEMSPMQSGSDSEDFMTIRTSFQKNKITDIYSDSSDTSENVKQAVHREGTAPNITSGIDGQQHSFRTKAAVKEFIPTLKESPKPVRRNRKPSARAELIVSCEEDKQAENTISKIKEYSSDLIVPQRKAAKKASENMRSTTVVKTKETDQPTDVKQSFNDESKSKPKSKSRLKENIKDAKKDRKNSASANEVELEKDDKDSQDILAYVPQRQAAKKAAEHIKSNMGTKAAELVNQDDGNKKKEPEPAKAEPTKKISPKKDGKSLNSPHKSSSSSSSSSSTSSYTSSSSSEEEEESSTTTSKELSDKPSTSLFSPPRVRKAVLDLPFLDKVSRPLSSSSSSDIEIPKEVSKHRRTPSPCRPYQKKSDAEENTAGVSQAKITEKHSKSRTSSPQKIPDKSIKISSSHLPKEKALKSTTIPDKQNKAVTDFQKPSDKSNRGSSITPTKGTEKNTKGNNDSEFKTSEKSHRGSNDTAPKICDKTSRGAHETQSNASEKSQKGASEVATKSSDKYAKGSNDTTNKSSEKPHKRTNKISPKSSDKLHKGDNLSPPKSCNKSFKAASVFHQKAADKHSDTSTVCSEKTANKKYPSSERRSHSGQEFQSPEREEPGRSSHAKSHSSSRPRARGSASGRDLFDKQDSKHRKSSVGETGSSAVSTDTKETIKSNEHSHKKRKIHETDVNIRQSRKPDEVKTASKKDGTITPDAKSHHKASMLETKNDKDSHSLYTSKRRSSIIAGSESSAKITARRPSSKILSSPNEFVKEIKKPTHKTEVKEFDRKTNSPAQLSPSNSQSPTCRTASSVINVDNKLQSDINYTTNSNDLCDNNKISPRPLIEKETFNEMRKSIDSNICDENKNDKICNADKNNFIDTTTSTFRSAKDIPEMESPIIISRGDVTLGEEYSNPIDGQTNMTQKIQKQASSHILNLNSCKDNRRNEKANKTTGIPMTSANRSIFSPQQANKDNSSELFDFGHDILSVDETVSDDSFGNTEIIKPMSFSFSSEFFFKEDSTEDKGVKETQNLVEKLRMNLISKNPVGNSVENVEQVMNTEPEQSILNPTDQSIDSIISISDTNTPDDKAEESNSHLSTQVCHSNSNNDDKSNDTQVVDTNDTIIMVDDDKVPGSVEMDSRENWRLSGTRAGSQLREEAETNQEVPQNVSFNMELMRTQDHMTNPDIYVESQPKNLYPSEAITDMMVAGYHKSSTDNEIRERLRHDVAESRDRRELMVTHNHLEMQNYTSGMLPECGASNSPYNMSQQKWSESKISVRSPSSPPTGRSPSPRKAVNIHNQEPRDIIENTHPAHSGNIAEMEYHQPYHSMDSLTYNAFSSEASQFVNAPISMFPSATAPSHLPLTSSANLYPAHMPVNYTSSVASLMSPIPKCPPPPHIPFSTLCAAAFTSSSHNIALTTAMVAPPSPKRVVEPSPRREENIDFTPPNTYRTNESPSTTSDSFSNLVPVAQLPSNKDIPDTNVISPIENLKSPTKTMRTSARFVSRASKSPSMSRSPERSPKQIDAASKSSSSSSSRRSTKSNRGQRGRGRSKGRGALPQNYASVDYMGNTIHSKLVGTVYELDLDEDIAKDGVDLKSMRERRRSIETNERKSEHSYKEASQSPPFTTKTAKPLHNKRASYSSDMKESRVASPADEHPNLSEAPQSPVEISSTESTTQSTFTNIVQPVLPGPVDMRTYSSFEPPPNPESFSNHLLGAFASGTADQQLTEIDEDAEKELHSALMASKSTPEESSPAAPPHDAPTRVYIPPPSPKEIPLPKVSLSDSRNQLKVKIKGPFLDANYSTSSVQPIIPPPPAPTVEAVGFPIPSAVGSASAAMLAGTTNLRRMRKKELLRQYWTQDMNMDDPASSSGVGIVPPPVPPTPVSRTVITIPKAVASMTSFPTREDYKAVVDANMEKKKKKIPGAMSRELRHLDMHDDLDISDDQYVLNITTPVTPAIQHKRRGRGASKPITSLGEIHGIPTAPKLKIKIGNNFNISTSTPMGESIFQCPPKKRISGIPKPSIEDLKRESMKFRRKVMADFEEGEKEAEQELRPRAEKRKKKKEGKKRKSSSGTHESKNLESGTTPKLIIRLARKKEEKGSSSAKEGSYVVEDSGLPPAKKYKAPAADPFHYDPSAPDPLAIEPSCGPAKLTPIRLKLARSAEGSGYVMKDSSGRDDSNTSPSTSALAPPISVSKHCEVR